MSLNYYIEKIKDSERDIYLVALMIIIGLLGFGLGRLSKIEESRAPITIKNEAVADKSIVTVTKANNLPGKYVASKTGSAYYLPWCSGAKRIKEANEVWFNTEEDAVSAGYSPASNCKGL